MVASLDVPAQYTLDGRSHLDVIDADTQQILSTRQLAPQRILVAGHATVTLPVIVDSNGTIR